MSNHSRSIIFILLVLSTSIVLSQELCPPFGVSVFEGDTELVVSWNEPIGSVGCGDEGIPSLPFSATGTNAGMGDDWDVAGGDGEDYTFTLNLSDAVVLDIDLCSATTDYDSKLEVFTADAACVATSTGYYDDDGTFGSCPESPAPYTPSHLENVALDAGQYYIVVDGFGGATGNFEIFVTEVTGRGAIADFKAAINEEAEKLLDLGGTQDDVDALWADARDHMSVTDNSREISPECGTFVSYEVYDASDNSLVGTVNDGSLQYLVTGVTNYTEYCYYVKTVYSEGSSANSDTACGIPAPYVPDAPTNVGVIVGDEELTMSWTPSTVPNVGLGYTETFEVPDLAAMWSVEGNWAIEDGVGNPDFGAVFNWSPSTTNYDYSMYSMLLPVGDTTDVDVVYDLYFSDWAGDGMEHLSVELWVDGAWVVLQDHANTGDIDWTTFTHTITDVSGTTQIRFRAYGADSFNINWWFVDNVSLLENMTGREITNSTISAMGDYLGGTTMDIAFSLYYESSDVEYLDGAFMTFPAGFTVNSASDIGGLVFNGETGDSVSWGEWNDDGFGEQNANADFTVNVTIDGGVSGPQTIGWGLSGDTWGGDPHDVSGTLILNETSFNEYDFMGYDVFIDGVVQNDVPTPSTMWLFDGLTNLQEYELGVSARHFPSYSSDTITVLATPQYLFGDIAGYILDPNGDPLDSAIVDAGGVVDTTGADGYYFLWNLNPGVYTVKAQRHNFEYSDAEVEVVAGPDPYALDLTLQPQLARATGLVAMGGDSEVSLVWHMPGGETDYDLFYYDDAFEAQIGCGGGCEFGVRFTPPGYPAALNSLLISVQGDASVVDGNIIAYVDPSGAAAGPVGDYVVLASGLDLSSPDGGLAQYLVDVSDAGFVIPSGDAYIMIQENSSGFMGIANDIEPQTPEFYDRNWVFSGGAYTTIFDAVGGDPSLTGDFGVLGTFFGAAGRSITTDATGRIVELPSMDVVPTQHTGVFRTTYPNTGERSIGRNPDYVSLLQGTYVPVSPMDASREDSLLGFSVYHMTTEGDTLVAETVGNDTTAVISVPVNYIEYCYNVTAWWSTDSYGDLESKPSGESCTVPYTSGDADFDSDVDLSDVVAVVDFILEITVPSPDQFRNCDFNNDEAINVADLVMMIDVIYGGAGKFIAFDQDAIADLALLMDDATALKLNLIYDGVVRGLQFTIDYDQSQMQIHAPQLYKMQDNVIVTTSEKEAGKLNVVVANIGGGSLDFSSGTLLNLPFDIVGGSGEAANITLKNSTLAGPAGELIPVNERSTSIDIVGLPGTFALHQNYPNPFNPTTEIRFDLPDVSNVKLTVYNLKGQQVRTLVANQMEAGFHTVIWNGQNDKGNPVASGMYLYMIDAGSFHDMKKMLLLK